MLKCWETRRKFSRSNVNLWKPALVKLPMICYFCISNFLRYLNYLKYQTSISHCFSRICSKMADFLSTPAKNNPIQEEYYDFLKWEFTFPKYFTLPEKDRIFSWIWKCLWNIFFLGKWNGVGINQFLSSRMNNWCFQVQHRTGRYFLAIIYKYLISNIYLIIDNFWSWYKFSLW